MRLSASSARTFTRSSAIAVTAGPREVGPTNSQGPLACQGPAKEAALQIGEMPAAAKCGSDTYDNGRYGKAAITPARHPPLINQIRTNLSRIVLIVEKRNSFAPISSVPPSGIGTGDTICHKRGPIGVSG